MNNKEFTEEYYIDRTKNLSVKWQRGKKMNCLPMWIADMDFKMDQRLIDALNDFIAKGDFGYMNLPQDYYDVFTGWHQKDTMSNTNRNGSASPEERSTPSIRWSMP